MDKETLSVKAENSNKVIANIDPQTEESLRAYDDNLRDEDNNMIKDIYTDEDAALDAKIALEESLARRKR